MDFMKAFDTVPHKRLNIKLKGYGIIGNIGKWIEGFLSNRKQRVNIEGSKSNWSSVVSGVPQGSVFGPVLFCLYINDLPSNVLSDIYLFADDTKMFRKVSSNEDAQLFQNDINKLLSWSKTWLLKFHPEKCKIMSIGYNTILYRFTMQKDDNDTVDLQEISNECDLGVTVDSKLKFKAHIQNKVNRANNIMGAIRRAFTFLDNENFKHIFKALVRPHVEYAACVWNPRLKIDWEILENVQR